MARTSAEVIVSFLKKYLTVKNIANWGGALTAIAGIVQMIPEGPLTIPIIASVVISAVGGSSKK